MQNEVYYRINCSKYNVDQDLIKVDHPIMFTVYRNDKKCVTMFWSGNKRIFYLILSHHHKMSLATQFALQICWTAWCDRIQQTCLKKKNWKTYDGYAKKIVTLDAFGVRVDPREHFVKKNTTLSKYQLESIGMCLGILFESFTTHRLSMKQSKMILNQAM